MTLERGVYITGLAVSEAGMSTSAQRREQTIRATTLIWFSAVYSALYLAAAVFSVSSESASGPV